MTRIDRSSANFSAEVKLRTLIQPKAKPAKLTLALLATAISVMLFGHRGIAQEQVTDLDAIASDGQVEVVYLPDTSVPYRDRRSDWSMVFGLAQENMTPNHFVSSQDQSTYTSLFGSNQIRMFQATAGLKYNGSLGALTVEGILASGNINDDRSGLARSLSIFKKGLQIGWTLDAIFKEPYVAPYVSGQIFELDYVDKGSATGSTSGTTAPTSSATAGLLIQLNSLDPTETASTAHREFGLNNTFLDLFVSEYNTSTSSTDPEFQTALSWGAGVRLEF